MQITRHEIVAAGFLSCVVFLLSGCSAWVTYPPIEGAAQIGHHRLEPVPSVMADAIRYIHETHEPTGETIVFNLPEGAPPRLFEDIQRRLRNAEILREEGQPAIHVKEIRVRATNAQADVLYPRGDGHYHFVTLYMKQRLLQHYRVENTRLWRIAAGDPPPPHYRPAEGSQANPDPADAPNDVPDENGADEAESAD